MLDTEVGNLVAFMSGLDSANPTAGTQPEP